MLQGNGSTDDVTNYAHVADYRHEFLRDPFLTCVPRQLKDKTVEGEASQSLRPS